MTEAERSDGERPRDGVFGNLPNSRPGIRSPRRGGTGPGEHREPDDGDDRERARTRPPRVTARTRPATAPPPPPDPPEPDAEDQVGGLDDLAWAGITVAAEAATVGVRLVSRALEAMREAVERR